MKYKRFTIFFFVIFCVYLIFPFAVSVEGNNTMVLLQNPGFEEFDENGPYFWTTYDYERDYQNKTGIAEFLIDTKIKKSGKSSGCIIIHSADDARFKQTVYTKENTIYKVSCWIMTENVGVEAKGGNISIDGLLVTSEDVKGTSGGWQYIEFTGKTEKDQKSFNITFGLGGYGSVNTGKVWFDDIAIEELSSVPAGVEVKAFYNEQKGNDKENKAENGAANSAENKQDQGNYTWIILALIGVFTVSGLYYIVTTSRKRKIESMSNENKMGTSIITNEDNDKQKNNLLKNFKYERLKLVKVDYLIMSIMTLVYLVIATINLGSLKVPEKGWLPERAGESITISFGKEYTLSRLYYYAGMGKGREVSGKYRLEYKENEISAGTNAGEADSNNSGSDIDNGISNSSGFKPLAVIDKKDIFIWKTVDLPGVSTSEIKIIVDTPGGTINELCFIDKDMKQIGNISISERNIAVSEDVVSSEQMAKAEGGSQATRDPQSLFDEQEKLEIRPSFMTGMYFDEIYHARTAYEHLNQIEPFESTHPPLGKVIISAGIAIFGMNPFGWRIMGMLFGAAMIPVMYLFGRKIFRKKIYGFAAAFLMMFDFMHFAQTRISTIDVYVTLFVILMFYYIYDFFMESPLLPDFRKTLKPLFMCGLFFGIGVASKWIALYGAAGIAFLIILAKYQEYLAISNRKLSEKKPSGGGRRRLSGTVLNWLTGNLPMTFLICLVFFLLIPAVIYVLSYIPFMQVPGTGHGLKNLIPYQVHMYNYHKNLVATHSFSSQWWTWPFMTRPIWYYSGKFVSEGMASTIVSFGNPAVWWIGIVTAPLALLLSVRRRDRRMVTIFTAICAQYLPWILIPRIAFIYHYFSIIPFIILTIVYIMEFIIEEYLKYKKTIYVYFGIVALLFVMFYPALSGMEVPKQYIDMLKWFKSWVF